MIKIKNKHILICEDEETIRDFIIINLNRYGFETTATETGEQALEQFKSNKKPIDIAILDVMLPGMNGFEVLKQIRKTDENIGIIMLTAKTQEMDKIKGLMLGADDYITKPFSPSELIARIDAIYRRINKNSKNEKTNKIIKSGPFKFNCQTNILTKNGQHIELTNVENQLIYLFLTKPETAITRTEILDSIWGKNYFGDEKIVDVNIRRLRMKIEDDPSNPNFIQTVWGYGYIWPIKLQ